MTTAYVRTNFNNVITFYIMLALHVDTILRYVLFAKKMRYF